MTSSDPQTLDPSSNSTPDDAKSNEASADSGIAPDSDQGNGGAQPEGGGAEGEGEDGEEGECGFCLYMKGGGCRDAFIDWENCIKEAEDNNENIVNKCFDVTSALRECMQAHADYYEPILRAEKAAEEEAMKEFEKEKEKVAEESQANDGQNQDKAGDSNQSK